MSRQALEDIARDLGCTVGDVATLIGERLAALGLITPGTATVHDGSPVPDDVPFHTIAVCVHEGVAHYFIEKETATGQTYHVPLADDGWIINDKGEMARGRYRR